MAQLNCESSSSGTQVVACTGQSKAYVQTAHGMVLVHWLRIAPETGLPGSGSQGKVP